MSKGLGKQERRMLDLLAAKGHEALMHFLTYKNGHMNPSEYNSRLRAFRSLKKKGLIVGERVTEQTILGPNTYTKLSVGKNATVSNLTTLKTGSDL